MEYEDLSEPQREVFHTAASEMQKIVWCHVVPVRVTRILDDKEHSYNTGTGTFIRIHHKNYLLTAWHVFAELLNSRGRGQEAYFIAGNAALEPPIIRYADRVNDILILEVPDADGGSIGAIAYEPPHRWPPRSVTTNDVVLLCGLPAYLRTEENESELLFGDYSVMQPVTSVADNQFMLHLERENWVSLGRANLPGPEVSLGGISGAPVFAVDPLSYELVGIVSEIGESLPLLCIKSLAHLPSTV
jgi:hypothetical protein